MPACATPRYGYIDSSDRQGEQANERRQLRSRYLWAMQQSMDVAALSVLMQQTAASGADWLDTVEFCERHQHLREALASAQQGLRLDPSHAQLQAALLVCCQRDGWDEEAFALAQQRLAQHPQDVQRLKCVWQCAAALRRTRGATLNALIEQALTPLAHANAHTTNPRISI